MQQEIIPRRKRIKPSAAMIIFHRYYEIQISGMHLLSEATLERFGSVTTGSTQDDHAIQASVTTAQFTIAGMAMLIKEGATFTVANRAVADEIFGHIRTHLEQWVRVTNNSMNPVDVPVEGLMELEELARHLYPHAMKNRGASKVESSLHQSLLDMVKNRSTIRIADNKQSGEKSASEIESYNPITEDLTRTLEARGVPWR